eukprot:1147890-Pelagomonas_calceolata.AAC.2
MVAEQGVGRGARPLRPVIAEQGVGAYPLRPVEAEQGVVAEKEGVVAEQMKDRVRPVVHLKDAMIRRCN